jgi:hypothetical protein
MIPLSENQHTQIQAHLSSYRQQLPLVGDYLVLLNPDYLVGEYPLFQHNDKYSRNTVYTLLRVDKITRNSVITAPESGFGFQYFRWQQEDGCLVMKYPNSVNPKISPCYLPRDALAYTGIDNLTLPHLMFRHRNTVECITCGCQTQIYKLHPHPEDTLVPPQECFNCEDCFERNSSAKN